MSEIEKSYVLGTHDAEVARLGLQSRLWRPRVFNCWQRAGISRGATVLDIGAGPGYASVDLAQLVGPTGRIIALERSAHFREVLIRRAKEHGLTNITPYEIDFDLDKIPVEGADFSWCRWVMAFVKTPELVVGKIAKALKPGGRAIFHEYVDYSSWKMIPRDERFEKFVAAVVASWRQSGGEPDIGGIIPGWLVNNGMRIISTEPVTYFVTPADPMWEWPLAFIETGTTRLVELGFLTDDEAKAVRDDFHRATANPKSHLLTPAVLEIIAEKI